MCNSVRHCYEQFHCVGFSFSALTQWLSGWWYETDVCFANTCMVVQDDATSGWCSGAPALYRFSANQRIVAIIKWNVFVFVIVLLFWWWCLSVPVLRDVTWSWSWPWYWYCTCWAFGPRCLVICFSHSLPMPYHTIPYQGANISISRARAIGVQPQEITLMCTASPAAHNLVSVAMICASPDALHSGQGIWHHAFQQ